MEDSTRELRAIQHQIWMSIPEQERFRKCGEMFELARTFAEQRAPDGLDRNGLFRFVFMEMYGVEFPGQN